MLTTPEALCRDLKDGCIVLQGIVNDDALADRVSSMFVSGYMRLKKVVESDSDDEEEESEEDDDEDYEGENTEHGEDDDEEGDYSDRWSDA
jgi:Ran GTPase-activating protein (RanGAP) involved in mRNA processing and transport